MKTKKAKKKPVKIVKPEVIEPVEIIETIEDQAEARYQEWKTEWEDRYLITIEDDWETGPGFISRSFYYTGIDDPGDELVGTYMIWIQEGGLTGSVVTWAAEEE